jgi:hypothetical protein
LNEVERGAREQSARKEQILHEEPATKEHLERQERPASQAKMNEQTHVLKELKRLCIQFQCEAEVQRRKQAEEEAAQNKLELEVMTAENAELEELAPDAASLQVRVQAELQLIDHARAEDALALNPLDEYAGVRQSEHEAELELQREELKGGQGGYGEGPGAGAGARGAPPPPPPLPAPCSSSNSLRSTAYFLLPLPPPC